MPYLVPDTFLSLWADLLQEANSFPFLPSSSDLHHHMPDKWAGTKRMYKTNLSSFEVVCPMHFAIALKIWLIKKYSVKNNISIWEIYWEKNLNYMKCKLKIQTIYCKVWSPYVNLINIKLIDFIIPYKRRKLFLIIVEQMHLFLTYSFHLKVFLKFRAF